MNETNSLNAEFFASYFSDDKLIKNYAPKAFDGLQEGHIAIPFPELDENELSKSKYLGSESDLAKPFISFNNKLYLQRYFIYETKIVNKINELRGYERSLFEERKIQLKALSVVINELFSDFTPEGPTEELINWQCVSALNSALHQFSIITGGPGTGKTTTVAKLLSILYALNPDLKVTLTAQTGKATARLKESLSNSKERINISDDIKNKFDEITPLTIHRLLGFVPKSVDFKHNAAKPLNYDVVIIDESSMIDVPLMAKLFTAIKKETRIILLGDRNQLASVEAGSIFGDLCKSVGDEINVFDRSAIDFFNSLIPKGKISDKYLSDTIRISDSICELKKSYRFSGHTGIGKFARQILEGEAFDVKEYSQLTSEEGVFIRKTIQNQDFDNYLQKFETYIQESDISVALKKLNEIKVLCATRSGSYGVAESNLRIEQFLSDQELINTKEEFYENRPILITKNDYNLNLYNGDIGICRKNESGDMRVFFEDSEKGIREVVPTFLNSYETVFAMTIHKSQGSEFSHVLMILPPEGKSEALLTKELVYTGITRAKKSVLLITEENVLNKSIALPVSRVSGIIERL